MYFNGTSQEINRVIKIDLISQEVSLKLQSLQKHFFLATCATDSLFTFHK